jgi:hypothetical protein
VVFLLCKWEKGTYYDTEVLQPDSLVLTQLGHLENTKLSLVVFLGTKSISILIFIVTSIAISKFVNNCLYLGTMSLQSVCHKRSCY